MELSQFPTRSKGLDRRRGQSVCLLLEDQDKQFHTRRLRRSKREVHPEFPLNHTAMLTFIGMMGNIVGNAGQGRSKTCKSKQSRLAITKR